ncbi:MAG: hypothetical protein WAW37_13900 [Syntrophobacteraceae bacterium]
MLNPFAYFDCIAIGLRIQKNLGDVDRSELHLLSYLSCLLSLYNKRPVSEWGYEFAVTQQGHPFSASLDESITILLQNGGLQGNGHFFVTTDAGIHEYQFFKTLTQNAEREPFINGACASTLAMPIGTIRHVLSQGPEIKNAVSLSQSRKLLATNALETLYEQFSALSTIIGLEVHDLMIPSLVWLSYLSSVSESQEKEL